jgi:hypothetical protein
MSFKDWNSDLRKDDFRKFASFDACPTDACPTDACPTDACPTDACPTGCAALFFFFIMLGYLNVAAG